MIPRAFAVAGVVLLLAGCAGEAGGATPQPTAACDAVETPPVQGGEHLLAGQEPPVPYASTPPTSGWHASGAFAIAVQPPAEPLSEPQHVSVLEAGGVVVSYADLPEGDLTALTERVSADYDGRVAVTPYDELDSGEVTFTGWGVVQRCDSLDLDALAAFVDAYADPEPAVPGSHT